MVVRGGGRDGGERGREGWWWEGEGGMVVGGGERDGGERGREGWW